MSAHQITFKGIPIFWRDSEMQFLLAGISVALFVMTNTLTTTNARDEHLRAVTENGHVVFIDSTGNVVIRPDVTRARSFVNGMSTIRSETGVWGYMNVRGEVVITPKYLSASDFHEGLASVAFADSEYGAINLKGDVVFRSGNAVGDFSEGLAMYLAPWTPQDGGSNKAGFVDVGGNIVIEARFLGAEQFQNGFATASSDGEQWGLIDRSGTFIIPAQFSRPLRFCEGLAAFEEDDLWGFIDIRGNRAIPAQFTRVGEFSEGVAAASIGQGGEWPKWGFIDRKGQWVIEPQFDGAERFSEGLAPILVMASPLERRWGYIDHNGEIVLRAQWLVAEAFAGGVAEVESHNRRGLINRAGELVWQDSETSEIENKQ
ncbi:MAG: WG repeat-containing protein [Phycisphaerales bacterium]